MSTRMALTSFLPVAVKQAWNFALFTGSDTHRLKLAGSHAYIANRNTSIALRGRCCAP